MSFEAIEQEIVKWDDASLCKLQALVVAIRVRNDDPAFPEKMARKIDDQAPEQWVTLDEFGKRLGMEPGE